MELGYVTLKTSAIVNISRIASYSHVVPQLKIELGKKDRTLFVNLGEVALALNVEGRYIVAYLGYDMESKFSVRTEPYYLVGHKSCKVLSKSLEKFIEMMVLCRKCGLAELGMEVDRKVYLVCKNCGVRYRCGCGDKFEKFVVKNEASVIDRLDVSCDTESV
jgi:translation initiation factor 2 beta subunit (eIF-2beta)/eIF-5